MHQRETLLQELGRIIGSGPTEKVNPHVKVEREEDCGDHVRRLLSYWVEPDDRAYGYLLVPKSRSDIPQPLVVCPHQTKPWGKDGPVGSADEAQYHYALDLVRQGFVAFAPDQFTAGQRLHSNVKPYDTYRLYEKWPEWSAGGKAAWDLGRALDFLVTFDEIDPTRIGAIGHSLGGHDALVLAALDERVKVAVINCGAALLRTEPRRREWARLGDHEYVYYRKLRPFVDAADLPFDFDRLAMLAAPRGLMMIHAINDQYFPGNIGWLEGTRAVSDYFRDAGRPEGFVTYFHRKGHCFPAEARAMAYRWLGDQLGLGG